MANEEVKTEEKKVNWIKIEVQNEKIVRQEEKFSVVKIDETHSTVLPARMIRKVKNGVTTFSFPDTFLFKVQERVQNPKTNFYEIVDEVEISAADLKARLG